MKLGVAAAYKAVMKPTEGTILTVVREAADVAVAAAEAADDISSVLDATIEEAKASLARTPELLPVLKEANVVDAGGMGLIKIFEGMKAFLADGVGIKASEQGEQSARADFASFDTEDIKFAYCTEFIVNIAPSARLKDPQKLRGYLEFIGDSVVVADDEDIIKCHVHTNNPGKAIEEALKYGFLSNMKIENMKEQLEREQLESGKQPAESNERVIVPPSKDFGFVAVSAGDGITAVFKDLAVDEIAFGGQTMNPSTEDILRCIDRVPAKTVFVLPNNKNIIMAAEMAVPLSDKEVIVLPTKTIPQGISALLAFDSEQTAGENKRNMSEAFKKVKSGSITYAVRDSVVDGRNIKEGELLCLAENKVKLVEKTLTKAAVKLTQELAEKNSSYMLMFYGADVTEEQAEEAKAQIIKKMGSSFEVNLINGGQSVYYYIFSIE